MAKMWAAILLLARIAESTQIAAASGRAALTQLRHASKGANFISSLEFKHVLRVCNAYPYDHAMDVYLGKDKLTSSPMPYKECGEFAPSLKAGDKIDFKVGDSSAGSFSIAELPSNDAVMLLVIYRHDTQSTAVSFESHVFSNLINSQIAVLDTHQGAAKAEPRIQDLKDAKTSRSEELRFDSVVAVNPGLYEVVLQTPDGETKARQKLVALNRESYVVVRCGLDAPKGAQAYPEDLIIFPQSDPAALEGAATSKSPFFALVLAMSAMMVSVFGA